MNNGAQNLNVANGLYACRIIFREVKNDIPKGRVFDIEINGATIEPHFFGPRDVPTPLLARRSPASLPAVFPPCSAATFRAQ